MRTADTAAPGTSPVDAFTPEGMSTATTGAADSLIASIWRAASSRGSPWKPVPKRASTITSASPSDRSSQPFERSSSAAILPSPPLAPPPVTAANERASGKRARISSATARPARSISSSTSCPASAARISSAV